MENKRKMIDLRKFIEMWREKGLNKIEVRIGDKEWKIENM